MLQSRWGVLGIDVWAIWQRPTAPALPQAGSFFLILPHKIYPLTRFPPVVVVPQSYIAVKNSSLIPIDGTSLSLWELIL